MHGPTAHQTAEAHVDRSVGLQIQRQRQSAFLMGLLFGALALQNVVWPVVLRMSDARWPEAPAIFSMGLAFAEVGLAVLVFALYAGRILTRATIALVLFSGAAFLAARSVESGFQPWLANMSIIAAAMSAPLIVMRLAGVAIVPIATAGEVRGSRQFTIWGLLVLTTVAAALLGIGRLVQVPWPRLGEIALFSVAIAVIPCVLGPLALSRSPWPASIVAGVTICPSVGALFTFTGFAPDNQPLELASMASIQGAVTVGACLVARMADYRLTGPWER